MGLVSKIQKLMMLVCIPRGFISGGVMRIQMYYSNSSASKEEKTLPAICRELRIEAHAIEKGLSLPEVREGFGKAKIQRLIELMDQYIEHGNDAYDEEAFLGALGMLQCYVNCADQYHLDTSSVDMEKYKPWIEKVDTGRYGVGKVYGGGYSDFPSLAHFRHSVRSFSDESLSSELVKNAVELAQTAPSACNRQSIRVIHVANKEICRKVLHIQGGAKGHSNTELLLVASDLSLYRYLSEADTPYLDGGIFLMNLLYACTHYGIATCPLIWDDYSDKRVSLRKILPINESLHVVALVQIGKHAENSVYAISSRRPVEDVLIEM